MKKIKDPSIATEKYDHRMNFKEPVSYNKWVEYIENNKDYFVWTEDTEKGKKISANIDQISEVIREGVLRTLNKRQACAEYNERKGYHEVLVTYIDKFGKISTTFMKRINRKHLQILLDMATYLDALLLNNGRQIINQDIIDLKYPPKS